MTSTENSPRPEADEFDTDLDHHSAEYARDPFPALSELQSKCPIAKSSQWGGFWLLTGYDVAFEALHTPEVFSSRPNEHGRRGTTGARRRQSGTYRLRLAGTRHVPLIPAVGLIAGLGS